jgi:ribose 5-phosphate isomerase A
MDAKQLAANCAVSYLENGMTVGLGTGSTAYWVILKTSERVREGLDIKAVATSGQTEKLARELGIPLLDIEQVDHIDIDIDGADEVDEYCNLIKGGGGALLREKIIAFGSKRFIVVVDESKLVKKLGAFPLPVEVIPFAWHLTGKHLENLGCKPVLRIKEEKPFVTDNSNYILDCHFGIIETPGPLNQALRNIPGVVENGLVVGIAERIVVGYRNGQVREIAK